MTKFEVYLEKLQAQSRAQVYAACNAELLRLRRTRTDEEVWAALKARKVATSVKAEKELVF